MRVWHVCVSAVHLPSHIPCHPMESYLSTCGHVLSVFLVCSISIRLEVCIVDACRRGREKGRGDESIQYVPVDVVGKGE